MKKEYLNLCWSIPTALLGLLGFFSTLLVCLEIGGAYYAEYAIAFMLSFGVFGFGAIYTFLEVYNNFIENKENKKEAK